MKNQETKTTTNTDVILESLRRGDELHRVETKRIDERFDDVSDKFKDVDVKYQIQFNAAKEALGIALIAQEKGTAAALDGTSKAIDKADIATDKRFSLLSEKIDGVVEAISKSAGTQGVYVTHSDLQTEMEKLRNSFESMLTPVISFMNNSTGKQQGVGQGWQTAVAIVGLVSLVVGLIFAFGK